MDKKKSLKLASLLFGVVAFFHLLRSVFSWPVLIANWDVPLWVSYIAVVVAGYLSWHMHSASSK